MRCSPRMRCGSCGTDSQSVCFADGFENSSHMQFVEEPERYRELVAGFLERVEQG